MKFRNKYVAKRIGTTALASILAFGLAIGSPVAALADDSEVAITSEEAAQEIIQAKKTDGSEELVTVSEDVQEMIRKGEVKLNEESGYLEDTKTGEKVDPETGERLKETPTDPTNPDKPTNPDQPENPDTPTNPDKPTSPDQPTTPDTPTTPDQPENPGTSDTPDQPTTPGTPDQSGDAGTSDEKKEEVVPGDKIDHSQEIQKAQEAAKKEDSDTAISNSELISRQQIVKLPEMVEDFRFWTVARKYAFAKTAINVRESIPEDITGKADTSEDAQKADVKAAKQDAKELKAAFDKENQKYNTKKTTKKTSKIKLTGLNIFSTVQLNAKASKKAAKAEKESEKQAELQKLQLEKAAKLSADLTAEQIKEKVRSVGKISQDGLLYILKEEDNGWLYVESGNVRGFVKASEVYTEDAAQKLLDVYQAQAKFKATKEKKDYTGIEGTAKTAEALVDAKENQAYTYLRATVNQTVNDKNPALVSAQINKDKNGILNIQEEQNANSKVVGTMTAGNLCYILVDQDADWVYVESDDVRGFVEKKYLQSDSETQKRIKEAGEASFTLAKESVKPEENEALYYTLTSTKQGTPSGEIRQSMLEYASQFVGNPYVWGGTSLTNGADCSGFVQQIYKAYGYDLPRVAADQSQYGTKIPVEDAQPGDLIFYAKDGYVYHVVMYAGDGKTIEAANEDVGIIYGTVYTKDAVWATRILDDNYTIAGGGIGEVNATQDMYGKNLGNFTITYYCACEICCNKADGITATGTPVVEGQTIAVDPNVIPYGTKVIIGGHVFTAEDCGGAIKQNHIDVYVNSHAEALALGVTNAEVYLVK